MIDRFDVVDCVRDVYAVVGVRMLLLLLLV